MAGNPAEEQARARVDHVLVGAWRAERFLSFERAVGVYEARHEDGRRGLASVLSAEPSTDPAATARFFREATVLALVPHERVVAVLERGTTEDGCACVILALLEGATCKAVAESRQDRRLDVDEVLHVAERALEGLAAAHERGLLHANLKPDKLFWTTDGEVVLTGWGDARPFGAKGASLSLPEPRGTGTPAFMPPEQALGEWERADARADLWALGATMFTLLTGHPVRRERHPNQQQLAAATKPAPSLATAAPAAPAGICAIVDGALAFDPSDRWPHARAMLQAVRALRAEVTGTMALANGAVAREAALPFEASADVAAARAADAGADVEPTAASGTGAGVAPAPPAETGADAATSAPAGAPAAVEPPRSPAVTTTQGVALSSGAPLLPFRPSAGTPPVAVSAGAAGQAPSSRDSRSPAGEPPVAEGPAFSQASSVAPRVGTGTLFGGRSSGRRIVPFRDRAPLFEPAVAPQPLSQTAAHEGGQSAPGEPADPLTSPSFLDTYAVLKLAEWSAPGAFAGKLAARGMDELAFRLRESLLSAALDREARAGRSQAAQRLAEAMERAARDSASP